MSKNDVRQRVKFKPRGTIEDSSDTSSNSRKRKDWSSTLMGAVVVAVFVCCISYFRYQQYLRDIIITPLDSPKIISDNNSLPSSDPSRFWGSYRPHAYFGLKARSKTSPVFGLMWMSQPRNTMPQLRHWCDQGDGLDSYSWKMHDGRNFGVQEIHDQNYVVVTEFVKLQGGDHGGDWTARVTFKPKDPAKPSVVSGFLYAALDGDNGSLEPELSKRHLKGIKGFHEDLGNFNVVFSSEKGKPNHKENYFISHAKQLDQLKDILYQNLKVEAWDKGRTVQYVTSSGKRVPKDVPGPNLIMKEVTAQLPFTMEMAFESGSFSTRNGRLVGEVFETFLASEIVKYNSKFEETFGLEKRKYSEKEIDFAKSVFSNMVGSIGYFYGSSLVQSKYNKEPVSYWNAPLYSGVPARPFFPRGFLWDEGFHNLLISMWDEEISKDIIGHWMDLMNRQGWIPREQILGVEARAKVPAEFVVQRNTNANPPTFFLPLQRLIKNMISSGTSKDKAYLRALYPRLKTWFNYYNNSQTGKDPFTYRWHGRDATLTKQLNPLTLASGLDDYPRASHPTDDERHVDLYCWIALASGVMADIARDLGEDADKYASFHKLLTDNHRLDALHWSSKGKQYSDFGLHTDKARLEKPKPPANLAPGQRPPHYDTTKIRVVLEEPSLKYVNALGYVSLFPFLTKIIEPSSPKLKHVLDDLTDPNKLWTDFGIRSISRKSKFYGRFNTEHDPPYWRGQIWINMNYLCLSALHHYRSVSGPYQDQAKSVYSNLRNNLVNNLSKEYFRTGFIWENYNDSTGEGKGAHPFTGWSALIVLIMAEKY